jgi:1,4-dihydroxy-6-naphthoate synthase
MISPMGIKFGFSPVPDGGFMVFGLAAGKVQADGLDIELVAATLPALNDRASRGELEATMISAAAYPYLRDRYVLARCGGCFADGRGPVLAAREPISEADLAHARVAVPDSTSSATLALQINRPGVRTRLLPADKIAQAARMGLADCVLLMTGESPASRQSGLCCVADVAAGWAEKAHKLPLPLTCVAIRSDLSEDLRLRIEQVLRASIEYGLAHRDEAVQFATQCARSASPAESDPESLGLYVSETTVNMGTGGQEAIEELLRRGHDAHILPNALPLQFVGE